LTILSGNQNNPSLIADILVEEDGLYDITLTDINGVSVKKPLVIKR